MFKINRALLLFDNSKTIVDIELSAFYISNMDIDNAATMLAELGNPHRLATFRLLVQAGPEGLPVKAIQDHLGIPKSTLSHHILHMVSVGIVTQTREGRSLRCRIDYERVRGLMDFLMEDCCAGLDRHCDFEEELVG